MEQDQIFDRCYLILSNMSYYSIIYKINRKSALKEFQNLQNMHKKECFKIGFRIVFGIFLLLLR